MKIKYSQEVDPLIVKIKILKHGDQNCIDIIRINGDGLKFYEHF